MVSSCPASDSWRPLVWITRHNHFTSIHFHSLVPWCRPRRIRPQKTRLSQSENSIRNGHVADFRKNIYQPGFKKWHEIKFRCVDLMEPHNQKKICIILNKWCFINRNMELHNWELWSPMIYGFLSPSPLLTTEQNKKNLFCKTISLHLFSICTYEYFTVRLRILRQYY